MALHTLQTQNISKFTFKEVTQLSQRDRAAWLVSYGQKWKTGNGRQYYTNIMGLSLTTVT